MFQSLLTVFAYAALAIMATAIAIGLLLHLFRFDNFISFAESIQELLSKRFRRRRNAIKNTARFLAYLTIVIALLACVAIFLRLSAQDKQPSSPGGASFSMPLLERWLKDNATIQQAHENQYRSIRGAIDRQTDAIKALDATLANKSFRIGLPTELSGPSPTNWSTAIWIVFVCTLFVVVPTIVCVAIALWRRGNGQRSITPLLSIGTIFSSIIGTLITIKDLNLHLTLYQSNKFEVHGNDKAPVQEIAIQLADSRAGTTEVDCGVDDFDGTNFMRIAWFPEGWATPNDNIAENKIEALKEFDKLTMQLDGIAKILTSSSSQLVGVLLIGGAHERQLKPNLAEKHGDNAGLALARSKWVRGRLLERMGAAHRSKIAVFGTNPGNVRVPRSVPESDEFSLDRAVQVCAMWDRGR